MSIGVKKSWEKMYWDSIKAIEENRKVVKSKEYQMKKLVEYLENAISKVPEDDLWILNEERDFLANFKEPSNKRYMV